MRKIVVRELPTDRPITIQVVMRSTGAGQPLARSGVHLLISKGVLLDRGRHGALINDRSTWDHVDADVMNWLYEFDPQGTLRLMSEVREAVEPTAARYAAERIPIGDCQRLLYLANELYGLGNVSPEEFQENRAQFGEYDQEFHRLVLTASGNPVFMGYSDAVAKALRSRLDATAAPGTASTSMAYFPQAPEKVALLMHVGYANAIISHKPEAAAAFSRALVAEASGRADSRLIQAGVKWAFREVSWSEKQLGEWHQVGGLL